MTVEITNSASALENRCIALPESRQLDLMADMFSRRGARVLRIPLVSIVDAPDQDAVQQFLQGFVRQAPDYFIILTGEGLRRLLSAAERGESREQIEAQLQACDKICRGPKPARVLRELGMKPQYSPAEATSEGIIELLESLDLSGKRIDVQLYGQDPNLKLMNYLESRQPALIRSVHPYAYEDAATDAKVRDFIVALARGEIDGVAFTSKPQVRRLFAVAEKYGIQAILRQGLAGTHIAAVGPVVRDELLAHGCEVAAMPDRSFFMKPLLREMEKLLA